MVLSVLEASLEPPLGFVLPFGEAWLEGGGVVGGSGIGPSFAKQAVVTMQAKIPARTLRFNRFMDITGIDPFFAPGQYGGVRAGSKLSTKIVAGTGRIFPRLSLHTRLHRVLD
jgi:hypothetical protein